MTGSLPPHVGQIVPGLRGHGVVFADPGDYHDIALALLAAGYAVREIDGGDIVRRAQALPALRTALDLREAAGHNLDALLDGLRELPDRLPGADRVVLLWRRAEQFIEGDPDVWDDVRDILQTASEELRGHGTAFETVAFVDGYDIPPLMLSARGRS